MNKIPSDPNSDLIYDLYGGGFLGQVTRIALLLDVFTPLSKGPASAESVAAACNASPEGVRNLLNYLCNTNTIKYDPEKDVFALTPTSAMFLVQDADTYAGDWVLANTDPKMWEKMLKTIRSGEPSGHVLPWAQDAWLESYSPSRIAYGLDIWQRVGLEVRPGDPLNMLDLASGCGIKTLAFAQVHKDVYVTCVDSASVLEVTHATAKRLGVEERVTLFPADILNADFGEGNSDTALLGLITYFLTPEQNRSVFGSAYRALKPGGKLVLDVIMSTKVPKEWASRATLINRTWAGGWAHSFDAYREWLIGVGFRVVKQHSEQLLSAEK